MTGRPGDAGRADGRDDRRGPPPRATRSARTPAEYSRGRAGARRSHPGRRVLPDPGLAAVRGADRRRSARRLPRAAHLEPVAVHVLAALRRTSTSSARRPEALVTVEDGRAMLHPIAGTRPRGATAEHDAALAAELVGDPKERAEHVMLVDLARNDLGRVCAPGTVEVVEFDGGRALQPRHAHRVDRRRRRGRRADAFDVLCACFPAGTLTGAPKVRAMEIIEELEPIRRGLYGGVGRLPRRRRRPRHRDRDPHRGDARRPAPTCRPAAGIVADSDPADRGHRVAEQGGGGPERARQRLTSLRPAGA